MNFKFGMTVDEAKKAVAMSLIDEKELENSQTELIFEGVKVNEFVVNELHLLFKSDKLEYIYYYFNEDVFDDLYDYLYENYGKPGIHNQVPRWELKIPNQLPHTENMTKNDFGYFCLRKKDNNCILQLSQNN